MTKEQKHFLLFATILLAIVVSVSQLFFSTIFVTNSFPGRIISIVIVWTATYLTHYWAVKTVTGKPEAFIRIFSIKMLFYMAFILGYLIFFRQHVVPFAAHFFVVYIIFGIFDVYLILRFVKKADSINKDLNR